MIWIFMHFGLFTEQMLALFKLLIGKIYHCIFKYSAIIFYINLDQMSYDTLANNQSAQSNKPLSIFGGFKKKV